MKIKNRYKPYSGGNLHKINQNLIKKESRSYGMNNRTII